MQIAVGLGVGLVYMGIMLGVVLRQRGKDRPAEHVDEVLSIIVAALLTACGAVGLLITHGAADGSAVHQFVRFLNWPFFLLIHRSDGPVLVGEPTIDGVMMCAAVMAGFTFWGGAVQGGRVLIARVRRRQAEAG